MTDTQKPIRSLYDILRQERARGFDDSAVIGGLDRFLLRFETELASALGEHPAYASMSPEQRAEWADSAVHSMRETLSSTRAAKTQTRRATRLPRHLQSQPSQPAKQQNREPRKPPTPPAKPARPLHLSDRISLMRGVSSSVQTRMESLGIENVGDLIYLFPNRHNDFSALKRVAQLAPGDDQTCIVHVWEATETMLGKRKSTQAVLRDDTGIVRAVWFNRPWLARQLKPGAQLAISGKLSVFMGNLVFQGPEYEFVDASYERTHTGRLVPVYPTTRGLSIRMLRSLVSQALDACLDQVEDILSEDIRHKTGLMSIRNALQQMHFPDDSASFNAARRRLAFDELFMLQMLVLSRRNEWKTENRSVALDADAKSISAFLDSLPFEPTGAQESALREVLDDIRSTTPMSRLLQGDVGSGKTVVAAAAMIAAILGEKQAAIMAPTEILAEQHFFTICTLLAGQDFEPAGGSIERIQALGIDRQLTVALLIGGLRKREREDIYALISAGLVDIVIGTHALIQSAVDIPNLALAIVDEQHRFGVAQRAALRDKGIEPHVLAMTATPIPRSLELTLYGDLDISIIDEMPPGRQTVQTRFINEDARNSAYEVIRNQLEKGRQAFVVCPLIDESESIDTKAAQEEYERLSVSVYPDRSVGLLHGRMSLTEKERVMGQFERGEIDVLVATPVIEVGIDVPNATVMLIDGAERFGLSQLHQLRGRVGRGLHESYCLLMSKSPGSDATQRLKLLERISDGFRLAEEDLRRRGPGDYFGARQSGVPSSKAAQVTDQDILALARREAVRLLAADPDLSRPENHTLSLTFEKYRERTLAEVS